MGKNLRGPRESVPDIKTLAQFGPRTGSIASLVVLGLLAWTGVVFAGPYDEWKAANFTAAELNDPSISGDNADPDGDGRSNLLEYAMGSNPRVSDAPTNDEPVYSISGNQLVITYVRNVGAPDLIYRVEVSTDMLTWTFGDTSVGFIAETSDDNFRNVTMADLTSVNDLMNSHFMRLRVLLNSAIDSDGDGLPDWWEIQYFGDLSKDGNWIGPSGLSNLLAYRRGANPLVPSVADVGLAATALVVFTPLQQ
jgi:hypothetical protein